MKIEVWSDFVCPFCYIGKRRLEKALAEVPGEAEVIFKSFELDPYAEKNTGQTIHEKLAAKYGRSIEGAKEMTDGMTEQAAMEGLDFRFDSMVPTNTMDAHRLAKFAEGKGVGTEVAERLFQAVFTDSKDVGDLEVLVELAGEAGLDREEVLEVLESKQHIAEVRTDEQEARNIGVQGVPFFVINGKYAVSGAQPKEVFVNGLKKALEEEQKPKFEDLSVDQDAACTEDGCEIPEQK